MDFISLILYFIIIIPSAVFHEYAHGWMAYQLGDPTAKYAGRLTLNPKAHIDLWGTILMPLLLFFGSGGRFMFAYAKPVPYNPYNLKNQRTGPLLVGIAGPIANFTLALVFGLAIRFAQPSIITSIFGIIVYANIALAVFNLVPIPPLDGSKILYAVLPDSARELKAVLERYGMIFLIIFVVFFFHYLDPVIQYLYQVFTGGGASFL